MAGCVSKHRVAPAARRALRPLHTDTQRLWPCAVSWWHGTVTTSESSLRPLSRFPGIVERLGSAQGFGGLASDGGGGNALNTPVL